MHFEDQKRRLVQFILPYGKGKFLGVFRAPTMFKNKRGVSLFTALLTDHYLIPEEVLPITHGGKTLFADSKTGGEYGTAYRFMGLIDAQLSQQPVLCGDHLVLVSKHGGVFWTVDLLKGGLREKAIYDDMSDPQRRFHDVSVPVIANVCAGPQGQLLVAARSRKASLKVFTAKKDEKEESEDAFFAWQNECLQREPELEWWSLDPSTGVITPIETPSGDVPTGVQTRHAWSQFRFEVHCDGRCTRMQ